MFWKYSRHLRNSSGVFIVAIISPMAAGSGVQSISGVYIEPCAVRREPCITLAALREDSYGLLMLQEPELFQPVFYYYKTE